MLLMVFINVLTNEVQESTANKILYVWPDNSANTSCSSQPCPTLSQLMLDDGTLPDVTNVEYHFLPGEHQVPVNIILNNLHNVSIIGIVSKQSPQVVLVGCLLSHVLRINTSYYVNIRNLAFKRCYNSQLQPIMYFTSLYLSWCFSCVVENVTFTNFGMLGENLMGNSYLNAIHMTHTEGQFCQGIAIAYFNDQLLTGKNEYHLLLNNINITGIGKGITCFNFDDFFMKGVSIFIARQAKNGTIVISNSFFKGIHDTAILIKSKCATFENTLVLNTCIFHSILAMNKPVVHVILSFLNKFISFNNCTFQNNYSEDSIVSIQIFRREHLICKLITRLNIVNFNSMSNIYFREGNFILNKGKIISLIAKNSDSKIKTTIIGPVIIKNNWSIPRLYHNDFAVFNLIVFIDMAVFIHGPVIISYNGAVRGSILHFISSEVLFSNKIIFEQNNCHQIISLELQYTCIKVMEYANITFICNKCGNKLIEVDNINSKNNFCLFQYMTFNSDTISPDNYAINVINTSTTQQKNCSYLYYHFNPKCQWLPTAAFQSYDSEKINHQIIHINDQQWNYHMICLCHENGSYDCNKNILGPVYPGQILQLGLCTPCSNKTFFLYAGTYDSLQTNTSCKITNPSEIINTISNHTKSIDYTIVSEASNICKLFLALYSHQYRVTHETFYIKLLSCPVGFILQDGICICDLVLTKIIDTCNIDDSAIKRPANTWITAINKTNDTKYLISDCPMDYCLPYSSNVNLLYPDLQCQFNRTGILCSQCQQPLSMVFGSSRCMECTNMHILIIIIVIVAGILLVVCLYLLNLTVTKGTINGIVLYANILSINDSYFFINNNAFKPLQVFISFTNLDLGIETCFYNGMDSYAKMWLQLFFPFYLIIIATLIIIASRYSTRILRLTFSRSLPVLATLFLLSYTGVLRTVLTVLFSYSTVTHLPSSYKQIVWSIDASVPLFGFKFTLLFIICVVLFFLLIPFNVVLLFTRYLSRFRIINHFKPLLDAFQGSYKDKYYYWIAVNLILRSIFFALYGLKLSFRLLIATIILIVFATYHGYICPNKNKVINVHELLLLINLTIMYAVSYYSNSYVFSQVTNIMISFAFIQFFAIVLCHLFTYTCHFDAGAILRTLREKITFYGSRKLLNNIELLDYYTEYQN